MLMSSKILVNTAVVLDSKLLLLVNLISTSKLDFAVKIILEMIGEENFTTEYILYSHSIV